MIACAYSGGLDSTAALLESGAELAVFVDYGQPARDRERAAVKTICNRFGIESRIVTIDGLALGNMIDAAGVPGPRIVQARNALILAATANALLNGGTVVFGAHLGDAVLYADCRTSFTAAISRALSVAYGVRVVAPFAHLSKREVLGLLGRHALDFRLCWSCYTPTGEGEPCGTCSSCLEREAACGRTAP